MKQIAEASTAYTTLTFKDKDGNPEAPLSFTYRVDCITTAAPVIADTVISSPSNPYTLIIPSSANVMQDATNRTEQKRITIKANYGVDDDINSDYAYEVKNLSKII